MDKLHGYLLEIRAEVLPKGPAAVAVRYTLNQWRALTRFLEDGDLEIDNGATERAPKELNTTAAAAARFAARFALLVVIPELRSAERVETRIPEPYCGAWPLDTCGSAPVVVRRPFRHSFVRW